jgi:tetratricopeptide (TPR) repeat protein
LQGFALSRSGWLIVSIVLALGFVLPAVAQEEDDAAVVVAFADGVRAFQEGRNEDAREHFERVTELQPWNGTARHWLGLTLLRLDRPGEALAEIERSLHGGSAPQVDPVWVRHDLGQAQLAAGDAPAAASTLGAVVAEVGARLERGRDDVSPLRHLLIRALEGQGTALAANGKPEEAGEVRRQVGTLKTEYASGGESGRAGSFAIRHLERRVERAESRLATAKGAPLDALVEELKNVAWEAESRLESRRADEILLARSLRRQGEALDRLGRPAEADSARTRAAALAPATADMGIVAPPWEGDLPALGVAARPWEASIALATLSDSNPSLLSEGLRVDTPTTGGRVVRGGESDRAAQLDLRLTLHPVRALHGWHLGATFEGRQSFYQSLGFFNIGDFRGLGYLAFGGSPLGYLTGPLGPVPVAADGGRRLSLLLQGGIDYTTLDDRGYLTTVEGSASLVYRPSRLWASQIDLHLQDSSYREEPIVGRRSGTEVRLGLSQSLSLGRSDRFLRLEALGGRRSAGRPFESSLLRGTAELFLPLPARPINLSLLGSWQQDDYANLESDLFFSAFDPFHPEFVELHPSATQRRDTTLRATASLSWTLPSRLQVLTRFTWIDRSSNLKSKLASLDYHRTILSVGARWLF